MTGKYLNILQNKLELDYTANSSTDNKNKISLLNSLINKCGINNDNILVKFGTPEELKEELLSYYSDGSKYSISCRFDSIHESLNQSLDTDHQSLTSFAQLIFSFGKKKYGDDKKLTTIANLITDEMNTEIGKKTIGKWMRGAMSITSNQQNVDRLNEIESILNLDINSLVTAAGINAAYVKVCHRVKQARTKSKGVVWDELPESFRNEFDEFVALKTQGKVCNAKKNLGRKGSAKKLSGENTWSIRDDNINRSADTFKSQICVYLGFLVYSYQVKLEELTSMSVLINWDYLEEYFNFRLNNAEGYHTTARFFTTLAANCYANGYFQVLATRLDESEWLEDDITSWHEYVSDLTECLLLPKAAELDKLHESKNPNDDNALANIKHMLPGNGKTFEHTVKVSTGILKFMNQRLSSLTAPLYRMTKSRSITFLKIALYRPLRITNFCKLKLIDDIEDLDSNASTICFNNDTQCWQINIPKNAFKNRHGKSCRHLNYFLSNKLNDDISQYIAIRQAYLNHIKIESDYFFIDSKGKQVAENALGNMLKEHTLEALISYYESENIKYSSYIAGINPHATRHIAASIYLDSHPGDVVGAALLLNDDIKTVIDTYVQPDIERYQQKANDLFDSLYSQ